MPEAERCNVEEYVNGDDLVTCNDMETESIQQQLDEVPNTITTFKDAIKAMEDIQDFLKSRGHMSTSVTYIGPAIDAVASLQVISMRQRTLDDYYV